MFNRKQKQIEFLEAALDRAQVQNRVLIGDIGRLKLHIEELEKTNQPSYDMNVLFAAVLDYGKIMKRLQAPDPVVAQASVRKVFDKYRIKL